MRKQEICTQKYLDSSGGHINLLINVIKIRRGLIGKKSMVQKLLCIIVSPSNM